jgi:hypothetical protein
MSSTLLTGTVDLTTLERAYTVADLALLTGETEAWIRECQRKGIITPLPERKYGIQFSRGSIFKLEAFKGLQEEFGHNSAVPARIIREAGPKLDELARGPEIWTVDALAAMSAAVVAAIWTPEVQAELARRFGALVK